MCWIEKKNKIKKKCCKGIEEKWMKMRWDESYFCGCKYITPEKKEATGGWLYGRFKHGFLIFIVPFWGWRCGWKKCEKIKLSAVYIVKICVIWWCEKKLFADFPKMEIIKFLSISLLIVVVPFAGTEPIEERGWSLFFILIFKGRITWFFRLIKILQCKENNICF